MYLYVLIGNLRELDSVVITMAHVGWGFYHEFKTVGSPASFILTPISKR